MDSGFCQAFGRLMVYSTTQIAKSRINKFEITMFCFLSCDVTSICLHTAHIVQLQQLTKIIVKLKNIVVC